MTPAGASLVGTVAAEQGLRARTGPPHRTGGLHVHHHGIVTPGVTTASAVSMETAAAEAGASAVLARAPLAVRISSHVAVWISVLLALEVELSRNWRPVGDNAAIASRAYQTFTAHPPLVGLLSTAGSRGHTVYDPGPLLFWLLSVPVRIIPYRACCGERR